MPTNDFCLCCKGPLDEDHGCTTCDPVTTKHPDWCDLHSGDCCDNCVLKDANKN